MYPKVLWENRSFSNKVLYSIVKVVTVLYKCIYFYFFPFLMLLLNYMSPRCDQLMVISVKSSIEKDFTPEYKPFCKHDPSIFITHLLDTSLF